MRTVGATTELMSSTPVLQDISAIQLTTTITTRTGSMSRSYVGYCKHMMRTHLNA